MISFLGVINTELDACLILYSTDYSLEVNNKELGAFKKTNNGYQFIATKRVSDCPIIINKFLLEVKHNGSIKVIEEVPLEELEFCI